jgi:hypothetical protein
MDMDTKARDDLKLKLMLVLVRDRRAMQGRIRSVRFMREYGALPESLGAMTLRGMSDEEHSRLAAGIGIRGKPAGAKCDLFLNDVGYRIQALALHPTLVADGIGVDGMRAVCRKTGVEADGLTEAFRAYWDKRLTGELPDGMPVGGEKSPFGGVKDRLCRVISYLLFAGDEQGNDAMFAADGLIDYTDPMDTETWATLGKEEAVDALWGRLRIGAAGDDWESARFRLWAPV